MKNNRLTYSEKRSRILPLLILCTITLFFLSSCVVTQKSSYFKTLQEKDTTLKSIVNNDFEPKIIAGDRLAITVNSLSNTEDLIFNGPVLSAIAGTVGTGYLVQPDGTVYLHRIGNLKVQGLTRRQVGKQIEEKLFPYMKEPIAQVQFLNHKITILGAVAKPQVLDMPGDQISLIDALVLSGDVTSDGKRTNITVIRDDNGAKKVKHLNLEDNSIFSSDWYYLRPNDIVMVSQDIQKESKEERRAKLQTTLAIVGSGISFLLIILDRVIK